MNERSVKLAFGLVIAALIVWYAINVFLLAFAAILLAIFLHALGVWGKKLTRLPYPLAMIVSLIIIFGILTLTFWLYSPLIGEQIERLVKELPEAAENLRDDVLPMLSSELFSQTDLTNKFSSLNEKILSQAVTIFSFTIGSVVSFIIFIVVGLYLAFDPNRYLQGLKLTIPAHRKESALKLLDKIGNSLRWWLVGKCISMIVVGILTFVGLWLLDVSLAVILGLLAALLTFIPYLGPILASIPAILIAFTQRPILALYVIILYLGIHAIEGYFITPYIEQKTVYIPPALTIMSQILLVVLVGGLGLALATPLAVVGLAFLPGTIGKKPLSPSLR